MQTYQSYAQLKKPRWAPPAKVFGPVWTFLYCLIIISFGAVFWLALTKQIPAAVALPFALNLVFNFSFTYFQFKLKNNYLAAADVLLTLATLVWTMLAIFPLVAWIGWMQIPYLLWVSFATVLQLTVTWLNG
jgi:tryptophan-rich sensory protein